MRNFRGLYYMTHLDNLASILSRGIYSHNQVRRRRIQARIVHDENVMCRRKNIVVGGRTLWDYVNLYFQPHNAMLYRLTHEFPNQIVVIKVKLGFTIEALRNRGIWVTDGNAASGSTRKSLPEAEFLEIISDNISLDSWYSDDEKEMNENKRRMMAECLVPVHVSQNHFEVIIVPNRQVAAQVQTVLPVTIDTDMFIW